MNTVYTKDLVWPARPLFGIVRPSFLTGTPTVPAQPSDPTRTDANPAPESVPRTADMKSRLKDAIAAEPPARAKVLSAAIRVLRKKGLAECSVEDLLVEGSVSRGSFYQYFQSKYDVAAALFRHMQQILISLSRGISGGERQPLARLENNFRIYLHAQTQLGWLYAMLLAEAKQPGSPLATARNELLDTMTALIDRSLRDMQDRAVEPDVIRALLLAMEELTLLVHQRGEFSEREARHIRDVMLPIIQRTLALPGEPLLDLPHAAAP